MLRTGQDNPKGFVAAPSLLLQSRPALQQIKNGLVATRIRTAQLLGECTPEHPKVQAARATEREIWRHLQAEMTRTIVAIEADSQLGNARIESLVTQQNDIEHRMRDIVSLRAGYDNLVKEVQKRTAILNESQGQLSDARASQMAAASASLITMLDGPAIPNSPVGPSNSMVLACGIFGLKPFSLAARGRTNRVRHAAVRGVRGHTTPEKG